LQGDLIGRLQGVGLVRDQGDTTPEAFTKLIKRTGAGGIAATMRRPAPRHR
jgi:hypothetical protein